MNDEILLRLNQIHHQYPDGKGGVNTVLNNINLIVGRHEFITLVGPSGCGKSTLLRLLLGNEKPHSGEIFLDGKPLGVTDRNRGIVFQRYSLFQHQTVLDNVAAGLLFEHSSLPKRIFFSPDFRKKRRLYREQATEFIDRVGLGQHKDKYPCQLSGGQRQRIAIVQTIIMKPKVVFMDEPFGALDDTTRQDMQIFILETWKENTDMTIFFVTHDLEEAAFLATRVIVLSQYYIEEKGEAKGSKIVMDEAVEGDHPKPMEFKYSPYFNDLIRRIRRDGLDPTVRQRVSAFNLTHPHSVRSVD